MLRKVMFALLIGLSIISLFVGVEDVTVKALFTGNKEATHVFLVSRVPRLVSVLVTGVGLSISGLIMQQLTRNKFVSPSTAVTMDAAKLGLIISTLLLSSTRLFGRMIFTFGFALVGTLLFTLLLRTVKFKNAIFIPLLGIMLGGIVDSITTFIAYRYDMEQFINASMIGNFSTILKGRYELLYLSIPFVIIAFFYASRFTVAGLGEDFAKNLGLNYNQIVNIGLIIVSLITSTVVIIVGTIPFLGLVVPNIVSIYRGDHMKETIVDVGLIGAIILLVCDLISRIIVSPYEISIGLTVGVTGSIIFIILLFRRFRHEG